MGREKGERGERGRSINACVSAELPRFAFFLPTHLEHQELLWTDERLAHRLGSIAANPVPSAINHEDPNVAIFVIARFPGVNRVNLTGRNGLQALCLIKLVAELLEPFACSLNDLLGGELILSQLRWRAEIACALVSA